MPVIPKSRIGLSKIEKRKWVTDVFLSSNFDLPVFLLVRVAGTSFTLKPKAQTLREFPDGFLCRRMPIPGPGGLLSCSLADCRLRF